jgi:hypothetical protein
MFAYLVIGFELAILYTIFWYVFIREPKPLKLRADQWGRYQRGSNHFTAYGAEHHPPYQPTDAIDQRQLYNQSRQRMAAHRRRQRLNLSQNYGDPRKRQAPFPLRDTTNYDYERRSAVERFLANLTRAITDLSAKPPLA